MTSPQLVSIASLSMLAASLRHVANSGTEAAGGAGWLCPLASIPFAVGASALITAFLRRRRPGEGLAAMLSRALGRTAGGIVTALFSVWFIAAAGIMLASGAARLTGTV